MSYGLTEYKEVLKSSEGLKGYKKYSYKLYSIYKLRKRIQLSF